MLDALEEQLAQVDWWVPGMREFEGTLFLLWLVVVPGLIGWGCVVLVRLWREKRSGWIGPQEYRWRSTERAGYFGNLAMNGCFLVPMLFVILTLSGLFVVALAISDNVAWNLQVLSGLIFWFFAYRWLFIRLQSGFHEPAAPDFDNDQLSEPVILQRTAQNQDAGWDEEPTGDPMKYHAP